MNFPSPGASTLVLQFKGLPRAATIGSHLLDTPRKIRARQD